MGIGRWSDVGNFRSELGSAVAADSPKPLVVLSLSSYNDVVGEIESIGAIAEAPEMPTWLSSTLKLFAQGQDAYSLDKTRPWGAVVQRGNGLSGYAFVPVHDAEGLSWDLEQYIQSTTDVGGDVYKVVGTQDNQQLFAKEHAGWLFVSDSPQTLAKLPEDPTQLLGGLPKQYDAAIRLQLQNVPAEHGKKLLAFLDKRVGQDLRDATSQKSTNLLGRMAYAMDQLTLGWTPHAD